MKSYTVTLLLSCFVLSLFAQIPPPDYIKKQEGITYAKTITVGEMKKHLTIIASDEFEGRETGTDGANKAAKYITGQLESFGVKPLKQLGDSYYQKVAYSFQQWGDVSVTANGKEYKIMRDFYSFASRNVDMPEITADEIMFLGYGIDHEDYSDYKGVDVKGKVIVIHEGEPRDASGLSIITGTKRGSKLKSKDKMKSAYEHGVKLVLIISPNTMKTINRYGNYLIEPSISLFKGEKEVTTANHMFISPSMAKGIFGKKIKKIGKANKKLLSTKTPQNITIATKFTAQMNKTAKVVNTNNILGFIEGTDKKDEVVIVSAHYDHIGKRGEDVFNGADDNGTGTTALLEMSQAFAQAKADGNAPRRSVLFLWVAGEEKGLLGSEYYSKNPIFPLENTVADVNVDMIGRTDKEYAKKGTSEYIHVIGSDRLSTELHTINEEMNEKYTNIILDYKYNDKKDPNRYYYRSDHYNFAKHGIPSIFYFSGVHEDYHKATDTVDKIEFVKMQKITTLIFHVAWELSNREKRIEVDVKN